MLFEVDGLLFVLLLAFWIWALLDAIATEAERCRNLPKGVWIILMLLLFDIGALAWVLLGRPPRGSWRPGSTDYSAPRRPIAPEDDPRFSPTPAITDRRSEELNRELERWEQENQRKKQDELDRRELELREREHREREHRDDD